ncbi:putative iron-regulated membrane protein [Bacteroidales bacterium Barb4]|nr:putative iron-regulated membrane protein [Bacteroidales bacterium Barb4]
MKKIARIIHSKLSGWIGLIITVICFSGATLVFETEIMQLCYPSRYYVKEVKDKALPLDRLMEAVNKQLPDTLSVGSVTISSDPAKNYRVGLAGQRTAAVYVDPYTAEIRDLQLAPQPNFFSVMRRLHRWLLDDFKHDGSFSLGKTVVGVTTLVMVFILITGIICWIPKTKKNLKARLKISIKHGWKRFMYDLHIAGGIYFAVVLLALALTGLTWSFSWYQNGFYRLFGAELPQMPAREMPASRPPADRGMSASRPPADRERTSSGERRQVRESANFAEWQNVINQLIKQNPDFMALTIRDGAASVSSPFLIGNSRASDNYSFDPQTGTITDIKYYKDTDKAGKLRGWIYSVHVGSWGGTITKIITFLAALFGATLPLTGYYIWFKKYLARRKKLDAV